MKRRIARQIGTALAVAGATLIASTAAGAQAVQFVGNVTGCFFTGAAPTSCSGGTATGSSVGSLTYTGSTFNAFSNATDGLFTLGTSPGTGSGGANVNNLGSFNLHDGDFNYTGQQFVLFMNFTQPSGVAGNNQYTAMLTGNLSNQTNGNVFINFVNTPHTYTFSNGTQLSFGINDLSINDETLATGGANVSVTGQGFVTAAVSTVPEPSSIALLGTGLVGLVPLVRRRKNIR